MNLDHAIERLYALKVDTTTRDGDGTPHEKPQGSAGVPPASSSSNAAKMAALPYTPIAPAPAPATDHHWQVSAILDPRRSTGEDQLLKLAGKTLLQSKDPAFHPDRNALQCRLNQLTA